jgi:cellulose synthase/poly-beta-1,6-N-acetylglucosamine synthase-like glycosyltransferase
MRYGTTMTPAECRPRGLIGTRAPRGAARHLVSLLSLPLLLANGYLALVTVAAYVRRGTTGPPAQGDRVPRLRYAVLVPAHDEAAVIGSTLESFARQRTAGASLSVHVVADNCSDDTVAIARAHGADVHERIDPERPGKGPALGWLLQQLRDRGDDFDAVIIMDADTTMGDGFLDVMDRELADADRSAWQAYYAVRAPETSPSVATRYAALALRHYVRPLGRTALGGSCGLFGNGMVFRADVLADREFSAHLTEDAEFQMELLLDGQLVGFVPDSRVEAEMPSTFAAARTQHERWELGRWQVARRYVPELLRRAIAPARRHRLAYVDAVLDQLVPPLSILAAATGAVVVGEAALRSGGRRRFGLAAASALALAFHVVGGLWLARAPRSVWIGLLHAPRLVIWKLVLLTRVIIRPGQVAWRRTQRNEPDNQALAS